MREAAKREMAAQGRPRPRCILNVSSVSGAACLQGSRPGVAAAKVCLLLLVHTGAAAPAFDGTGWCRVRQPTGATAPACPRTLAWPAATARVPAAACRRARQRGSGQLLDCQGGGGGPDQGCRQRVGTLWHPLQRADIRIHQHTVSLPAGGVKGRAGMGRAGRAWARQEAGVPEAVASLSSPAAGTPSRWVRLRASPATLPGVAPQAGSAQGQGGQHPGGWGAGQAGHPAGGSCGVGRWGEEDASHGAIGGATGGGPLRSRRLSWAPSCPCHPCMLAVQLVAGPAPQVEAPDLQPKACT